MSKAQNRHDTIKWKKKRKNHVGDKCHRAKCSICSYHKKLGNSKGKKKRKYWDDDWYTKRHLKDD